LLVDNVEKLNSNRDELNKAIRRERTTLLFQVIGGIAALLTIFTFIISYFFSICSAAPEEISHSISKEPVSHLTLSMISDQPTHAFHDLS